MPLRKAPPRPQSPELKPVDPQVTRYSLSDAPYDGYGGSQETLRLSQGDPYQGSAHPETSYGSASTAYIPPTVEYQPYQPGQHLVPIITGETLKLVADQQRMPPPPMPPLPMEYYEGATPIALQATSPLPEPSQGYYYDQGQDYLQPEEQHYASSYEESGLMPAGAEIDHFGYDAEAFASGINSRASYRPPRSRSPTPAVDDEDYYVVGNESIHHIGYPEGHQEYDDEKEAHHQRYSSHSTYYAERGYLPDGTEVMFDPEPETPTSTLYSLPASENPGETRHFGPAPTGRVLRRNKTKRRVQLTNGNLVMDLDVPPRLVLPRRGEPETMKARYTAVTCDPDDFEKSGFCLRQNESGRRTEMFIVITMYNEDEFLFCRTLYGVMRNIAHLCTRKNSQTWGPNAWEKVVVCIVADGRKKVHPRVLDCLTLLGVYQPGGFMKNRVNDKEVTAHLFEYTTSFAIDPNLHFRYPDKGIVPTQIIFCMKEKNQKKINSHRWFFNAFGPMLQPNVCVLLDVGTQPGPNSIYRLWKAFDINSNVGGACGEIATYKGKNWSLLLNPLVAAQNFEYKISGILDKPTESMFGYISVLPGAFSAYRYIALQNNEHGIGPLASYFKGEVLHGRDTDIFTSNMYLAEDRILCFELIAKANSSWILKYVKGAIGETDVPDALPEFISQRRRWLNGSFFAAVYAIAHVGQIMDSGHSLIRKTFFMVETVYNIINIIFAWFSIGNFYLFFIVLTTSLEDPSFGLAGIKYFNAFAHFLMASLVVAVFLFSMGNKPRSAAWKYKTASIILSILMFYMMIASIKCAMQASKQGSTENSLILLSVVVTYGVYLFSSLLAFDPWHMVTSFFQYMLLSPTYINILNVYAFSNLDDISWGTKQDSTPDTDLGEVNQDKSSHVDVEMLTEPADVNSIYEEALSNLRDRVPIKEKNREIVLSTAEKEAAAKEYYAGVRTNVLLAWVLTNGVLLAVILGGMNATDAFGVKVGLTKVKGYLIFILIFTAVSNLLRFAGSTIYLFLYLLTG